MRDMLLVEDGNFRMGDVLAEDVQLATPPHEVTGGDWMEKATGATLSMSRPPGTRWSPDACYSQHKEISVEN